MVARYLTSTSPTQEQNASNTNEFNSPQHGRLIDLSKFALFLADRCTKRDEILQSQHVAPHLLVIQQLAHALEYSLGSRGDIWCDQCCVLLKEFRSHYEQSYAALPSSTHIAESNVKDANFCQIKGRGEALASAFSTARSGLVEPIHRLAKGEFQKKDNYKGNGRVSGGTKVSRIRKVDNTNFEDASADSRLLAVRGTIKTSEAIKYIQSRHKSIQHLLEENPALNDVWNVIHKNVSEKGNQFAAGRVAAKVENYEKHKHKDKPKNRLQSRKGTHQTPYVLGRIHYSQLRKDRDTNDIKKELEYRELGTDGGWQKHLLARLKSHEGDQKSFKPQHPDLVSTWFERILHGSPENNE